MNKDEVLKVARDCEIQVLFDSKLGRDDYHSAFCSLPALERFAAAMYAKGAEDMRERTAVECLVRFERAEAEFEISKVDYWEGRMDEAGLCADAIRALPITTNTEGEMVSYAHESEPEGYRFCQYAKDPLPKWAVDIKPYDSTNEGKG